MRILVTGAAGFIGSNLVDALIEQDHEVVGIDNLVTGNRLNFDEDHAKLFLGDIRDGIPQGDWDVIYHCAASYKDRNDWERDASTNVLGTIRVVREAARSGAKIVYFQTSLCYGLNPPSPVTTDTPLNPQGSYAISKTAGERYIFDSGVPFVSLRLANVYGPRNLSGPVPAFYQRLSDDKQCTVVNSRRDFIFIDDLVALALKTAVSGQGIYHASTGEDVSIAEMYSLVVGAMGIEDRPEPVSVERGPDDAATILLDPIETYEQFYWSANTPMVKGIREAVDWYRRHGVTETYTHLAVEKGS